MTAEFAEYKLAELCVGVFDCPHSTPFWASSGTLVLRNYNIRKGRLDLSEPSFTDEAHYRERVRRAIPESEDIVITREAPMGEVAMIPNGLKCCLGQRMVLLKPNRKFINPRFLLYALQGDYVQDQISWSEGSGTTVSNLRIPDLCALKVLVPSHYEQDFIANLLGTIDDRIALNDKLNAALEATAAAVFKSWFVDFDPVVAKSEGRKPFGMTDEIAALFPDRFAPNGLPEGWSFDSLDGIAHYKNGLAMQKYPPNASGSLPVIKIAELRAGSPVGADEAAASIPSDVIIDDGDVVFSWSGTLLVKIWCGGKGALNQHLFKVTSERYPKWFYYWWTREHLADFIEIADDKKTTMGHIKRHHLTDAKVAVPSPELLSAADGAFGPLLDRVILNEKQNRALRNLRDAILPGLVSGELQIKEVEREIAEVVG